MLSKLSSCGLMMQESQENQFRLQWLPLNRKSSGGKAAYSIFPLIDSTAKHLYNRLVLQFLTLGV